jgi:hypothetical protein
VPRRTVLRIILDIAYNINRNIDLSVLFFYILVWNLYLLSYVMGCTNSKPKSKQASLTCTPKSEPIPTSSKVKDDLYHLVEDGQFQAQVSERAFQIFMHDALPDSWQLQFDLLIALKFVFDRIGPKRATVIFPNLPLRYPSGDTKILLKLTSIANVHEGIQLWVEHLIREGTVYINGSDWQAAFKHTALGYRIAQDEDVAHCNGTYLPTKSLKQSVEEAKRNAKEEMTKTIEKVFNQCQLAQDASNEALKDTVSQKARDLLPRYMEPVPLDFAIHNFRNLMETSHNSEIGMRLSNVALQTIIDAKEAFASGFGATVKIVIVQGSITQAHTNILLRAKTEAYLSVDEDFKGRKPQKLGSYGVCFASLPDTGSSHVWRRLSNDSNRYKEFCDYVELPTIVTYDFVSGSFVRRLLLGSVA